MKYWVYTCHFKFAQAKPEAQIRFIELAATLAGKKEIE